jgi:hypothetical protein
VSESVRNETASDEMKAVLNAVTEFAKDQVEKRGSFLPFAATITTDGDLRMVIADIAVDQPEPIALLEPLYASLRRQASDGAIRAAAVCVDVRIRQTEGDEATDAIQAMVEHRDAKPVNVFRPYAKRRLRGVAFGDPYPEPGEDRIFDSDAT